MIGLRPYRAEDLNALYAIDVACFEEPFRFSRAALKRYLESPHARTAIAENSSGIAGFILVHVEPGNPLHGYVVTLDVLGSNRRTGIGSRLLREGELLASTAGAVSMRLHVHTENRAAQSFYERMGYQRVGTVSGFYGRSLDAFLLEKPLACTSVLSE